jgi:hypothetical protein
MGQAVNSKSKLTFKKATTIFPSVPVGSLHNETTPRNDT